MTNEKIADFVCLCAYERTLEQLGFSSDTSLETLVAEEILESEQPTKPFRYWFKPKHRELYGNWITYYYQKMADITQSENTF